MANQAAWIPAVEADLVLQDGTEIPTPGHGELLVKVKCIAFSPIEAKIQKFGTHPIPYPSILGTSFAGIIESVPPSTTVFKPGDNIAVIRTGAHQGDPRFGAFQKFALADSSSVSKLHPSTPLPAAAASILNLAAVVSALSIHLGLSRPPLSGPPPPANTNKKVLIYGGSSSCGGLAVKYAVTAGYTVVTTSSPANHAFVASLAPAHIIDHTLPATEIVSAIRARGPYAAIFDTIGLPPCTDILVDYLSSVGGGAYNTLIPLEGPEKPIPENVERKFAAYSWALDEPKHAEIREWFYDEYLPKGLESGLVVPTRQHAVEGGLGEAQGVLDLIMKGGVSGHKLVMDPWA
ncbi:hypothetical protein HO173_010084 [Letharia columbiana]|uniref:Alcohol dehydrogenase-like N-terminal domain-containing protein n=1 Tax=Letharia columbiana TaxID=112416 RepID=A0A8H6L1A7_9LECA|nr:uncharacterized protein HO173_010084 [Letharia columbiana]KAF6231782.1 hypothetical protein HO173_010084 [Letharia columbiana]